LPLARACQPEVPVHQAMPLPPSAPEQSDVSQSHRFEPVGPLSNDRACGPAHRTLGSPPPHYRHTPAPLRAPSPPPPRSRIVSAESPSSQRTIPLSAAKVNGLPLPLPDSVFFICLKSATSLTATFFIRSNVTGGVWNVRESRISCFGRASFLAHS